MSKKPALENEQTTSPADEKAMFSDTVEPAARPGTPWYGDMPVIAGIILTLVWGFAAADYAVSAGWWESRLEMTPAEYMSFLSGILSPFAFIWIAAAYFSSQRRYVKEAEQLRRYIGEFTHPSTQNKLYVKSLLDDIREQTAELNTVYDKLRSCTDGVGDGLGRQAEVLSEVVEKLERNVSEAAGKIENKTGELASAAASVNAQAEKNTALMEAHLKAIRQAADVTAETLSSVNTALEEDTALLKKTGDTLTDNAMILSQELREQADILRTASDAASGTLSRQTAAVTAELAAQTEMLVGTGTRVHDMLSEQMDLMKKDIRSQTDMILRSGASARDNMAEITADLTEQTDALREISDTARTNTEKMIAGLEQRTSRLEEIFERQNTAIAEKDEALIQTAEQLQSTFKEQNALLDQEAEKIVGRFKTIETTLDTYVSEINAASSAAIEQITGVSEAMDNRAEQISSAAGQAYKQIRAVADEMENRTGRMNNALARLQTGSETVAESLSGQTHLLETALDETSARLERLKTEILQNIETVRESVDETEEKSDNACQRLMKHATELSDLTSALVSQAIVTETSLAQQQKYISNASARLEETKAALKEQSDDLTGIADLLDTRAAETVLRLARLMEDALSQAGRVTDKVGELDISLTTRINALDMSAQRTVAANTALQEELERHKAMLDASADKMTTYTEEMTAEIARQTTQMDVSSELVKSRTEKAVFQISEQFRKMEEDAGNMLESTVRAASEIARHSEKAESLFHRQSASLSAVSDKLSEQTSQAAAMLREQSEQADKDLERLISRIHLIEEGLNVQTKELANASEMTVSQLETVGSALSRQTDNLSSLTETAKSKINETSEVLAARARELSAVTQSACTQNLSSAEQLEKKQAEFREASDLLIERMSRLSEELEEQTDSLHKQSARSTQQAVMIRDSMQRHIIDLGDVANIVATQSRLGEASLSNQINYLREAAEDVMTHIRSINEAVRQNTNDLLTASSRIGFELDAMGENLRRRNEEASKAAEDSLDRSQTAAQFLEEKARLLADMTEQVIGGLNNAGSEFSAQTNRIEAASEIAREQLETTGETFLVQSHQVTRIAEETQKAIKNYSVVLRERAADFNKTADDAGTRVRALNETVHQIGKEFEEMSNKGVIQIDLAGQRLRAMISEVAGNSERIAVEVRKSGEQFVDQSDLLSIAAEEALKRLQELLSLMRENAKEIQESGEKISAQSLKLGGAFNRQVQSLISASRSAEEYISALDRKKEEADTDRFMRDAAFIIERLQSLGVDIARLFAPNVEEDLWKRYYSGDRSAFVRYLSRAVDKNQVRKMCDMFTEHSEFREYISRYMGEFEGVLSRAQENERSDVLTGVLLGSEAGRLYMLLSRVFNKDA